MTTKKKELPLVVLFGRTNVGKSTLFNRLTEKSHALVANIEGTTRDANTDLVDWNGKEFRLVDTGGIIDFEYLFEKRKTTDDIEAKVQKQATSFLKKADLVLFTVDCITGLIAHDKQMALLVKKILKDTSKVVLVANKSDGLRRGDANDFFKLAFGEPVLVSSTSGSGTGDLLDIIVKKLKIRKKTSIKEIKEDDDIKISIMGKPNVGKSSLLNAILGEERVIVSEIAHTTREPQDTEIVYKGKKFRIIDTAGINREGYKQSKHRRDELKDAEDLVYGGISKSFGALSRSNIALMVLDINNDITHQDQTIMDEILSRKKSLIIVANKWDATPERDTKKYTEYIHRHFPFAQWAEILFVSAKTKEKVTKIMDLALEIAESRKKKLSDSVLNTFMMRIVKLHRPSKGKGVRYPRIHKFIQTEVNPPRFEMRIGNKEDLHSSYIRFVENRLREKFGFLSTPISINVEKSKKVHGAHKVKTYLSSNEKGLRRDDGDDEDETIMPEEKEWKGSKQERSREKKVTKKKVKK